MLTLDLGPALAHLALLQARLAYPQPVLSMIGSRARARVQSEIESGKHEPDDVHLWAPWEPSTEHEREKRGNVAQGLLWDTGGLLHSINVQVGAVEVVIGTDDPHAEFLQEGTRRMHARAFLGWSDLSMYEAERTMIDYLEAGL